MAVKGHIDQVANGHIHGWVWDNTSPTATLNVVACVNDRIIASSVANLFREDLLQAGIGTGQHGFDLSVPDLTIKNDHIRIIEELSQTEIGTVSICESVKRANSLSIVIDVTDIVVYLDKFNKLTGIPRVQVEILRAIVANGLYDLDRVVFVALAYESRKFEIVNKNDLFVVFENRLGDNGSVSLKKTQFYHIEKHLSFQSFNPDGSFCRNAIFLALGSSPWGLPDFFVRVNEFLTKGMRLALLYHDIVPLARPNLSTAEMTDMFHLFVRSSFIFCDTLMAVSEHCAKDVETFARERGYVCPPIFVLKNGASTALPMDAGITRDEPYVLVVGTIEKRKNHLLLTRAWQRLLRKYGTKIPKLVFVGSFGLDIQPLFDFLRETSCLDGHVQILTSVSDARLASLYKGCLFTAYPSLYEGWGLPVTESLAFGKVCLCSRASALPEAGLDYCTYFHPNDLDEVTNQVEKLIFDSQYRLALEERIAREYVPPQWRHIAEKLIVWMEKTGEKPHKAAPRLRTGVEVAFWLPQPYPLEKENIGRALASFSEGYLTDSRLTWDNYCLAAGVVTSGRLYPRTSTGWRGDPDGNTISIALESAAEAALLHLYILFEVSGAQQQIEFYCECILVKSFTVDVGICLVCLKAADFVVGDGVKLFVKSSSNEAIIYKSILLLGEDDLRGRLTVQERFANISFNRAQ